MYHGWQWVWSLVLLALAAAGCGPEWASVAIRARSPASLQTELRSADFTVTSVAMSTDGISWLEVLPQAVPLSIAPNMDTSLVAASLAPGTYHGIRVMLSPGYAVEYADGTALQLDYPTNLLYVVGGMYRYSNSGNGFPDTNRYFIFTTRNGAIAAPFTVGSAENSHLEVFFEPLVAPAADGSLAARVVITPLEQ